MDSLIEVLAGLAILANASFTGPMSSARSSCVPPSPQSTIAPSPSYSATFTASPTAASRRSVPAA